MSGARAEPALAARGGLARALMLLRSTIEFEFRKQTAFRTGFVVRELIQGLARPLTLIFVYRALFRSNGGQLIGGYDFQGMVHYMLLLACYHKLLFHERALDLSTQIFEGYVTKYLVMPFRYFTLLLGRFFQFMTVQLGVAGLLYALGAVLLPQWWPTPVSTVALLQSLALVLLGSYCLFLTFVIVNCLAFWLDVVWNLVIMVRFLTFFVAGEMVPVSVMPALLRDTFVWTFPYWSLSAPIELFTGRLTTPDFVQGLAVLTGWIVVLDVARRVVWRRGVRQYAGSGM